MSERDVREKIAKICKELDEGYCTLSGGCPDHSDCSYCGADQILSLKDEQGKELLAVLADDQGFDGRSLSECIYAGLRWLITHIGEYSDNEVLLRHSVGQIEGALVNFRRVV